MPGSVSKQAVQRPQLAHDTPTPLLPNVRVLGLVARTPRHSVSALRNSATNYERARMTNRDYAELINLAAEMARCAGMPSPLIDDAYFYRSTPVAERRRYRQVAERAEEQAKQWAVRLRAVADRLSSGKSVP